MDCHICQRAHHPKRLPFLCVVDARNKMYEGRIANARILMEMEELESRVNKLVVGKGVSTAASAATASDCSSRICTENCTSEEQQTRERTERIISAADKLREEVAAAKKEVEDRRVALNRRKSDLASESQNVTARRTREVEETRKSIKMTKYTWSREYEALAQYRAALCMEVAKLYRLQRVRRGNPVRFEYKIGGIDILDLRNMNNAQPEPLSASLSYVTHLLWLASHYLAIRLPAEITLPHNDYPRPTIFSLASSYHHGDVVFPGSSPLPTDPRDRQFAHIPHPRPLYIDKPLGTLAKEDVSSYNSFLEAVCLLAYNIVWLCRTQGVPVGDNSGNFEDFTCIGRNLYNLLINSSLQRNPQQIADATRNAADVSGSNDTAELGKAAPHMGWYSHGAAHTFLGSAAGNELTRSFKMQNPVKMADKLKSKLLHENLIPEWEVLEDDAWAPDEADEGVLVGGAKPKPKIGERGGNFGQESYMSVNTVRTAGGEAAPPRLGKNGVSPTLRDREKGTNGWTKIKPR